MFTIKKTEAMSLLHPVLTPRTGGNESGMCRNLIYQQSKQQQLAFSARASHPQARHTEQEQ